jgi:DeoR/GlpR family transcriptional regulator of sugar metabolism
VIVSAQQLFALVDSSKFGKEDFTPFAHPSQITRLFTDAGISAAWQARLQEVNVPLVICKNDE